MIEFFARPLFTIPLIDMEITAWTLFGLTGNALFTARVLIQWFASERAGRSVVPVSFWWTSLAASLILITYCYGKPDIPMILGLASTIIPYVRNLMIHYRPDRKPKPLGLVLAVAVALGCIPVMIFWKDHAIKDIWFFFGLLANGIFRSRFIVQWVQTERSRKSDLPLSFWWLSLIGSVMLLVYSLIRNDPVFILGFMFNWVPFVRNIMLIHKGKAPREKA